MSSGSQIPYEPSDNPPRIPICGDIFFFEDGAHVALGTGARRDGTDREVLSFWPPPDVVPYTAGTLDKVKLTTIEELVAFMSGAICSTRSRTRHRPGEPGKEGVTLGLTVPRADS